MLRRSIGIAILACTVVPCALAYHVSRETHLPGTEGWDYLTTDGAGERLYVSHGSRVEVLDANRLAVVGVVENTPGVHGIALAEDLGKGFISAGAADEVVVFDLKTLARIAEIKTTGGNPDAILYDSATHEILTFNGRGRNITAIDARNNVVLGSLALNAKPEFAVADNLGHVFVNLEDTGSLARLDVKAMKLEAVWRLQGCEEPSGLAMDRAHDRLFSVCANRVMVITDGKTGRQVARLPIGGNVDGAAFDQERLEAFASGGDSTLTVVKESSPEKFSVAETAASRSGARTLALDQAHHRLFLSSGERRPGTPSAEQPRPRPTIVPDSFEVLEMKP